MPSVKNEIIHLLDEIDDNLPYEDVLYTLHVKMKLQKSRKDFEEGRVHSHEEVKNILENHDYNMDR